MNLLFELLTVRPGILSELIHGTPVNESPATLRRAAQLLNLRAPQEQLTGTVLEQAGERAFLPIRSAQDWGVPAWSAPHWTPPPGTRDLESATEIDHWVTFMGAQTGGDLGLSVPDDRSSRPNMTAFVPMTTAADAPLMRLTLEMDTTRTQFTGYSLTTGGDCGDPIGTSCERNLCGSCVNELIVVKGYAARTCRCPHQG
jgi:hypothetical protein